MKNKALPFVTYLTFLMSVIGSANISANTANNKYTETDLSALYAKAFGKKQTVVLPTKLNVELRIDKTVIGDVTLFSNQQGHLDRTNTKELLTYLQEILKAHIYQRIEKNLTKSKQTLLHKALLRTTILLI